MEIDYKQLAQELLTGVTVKNVPSSTPNATLGHGPGGLFSYPGLSRPVFSAMVLPKAGLLSLLPVRPSQETNPLFGIITGVTGSTGSEPEGPCDDPPYSGLLKLCMHSAVFGRWSRMTKVYDVSNMGAITNRGEFTDLLVQNTPELMNAPTMPAGDTLAAAAQREVAKALFELAVTWQRDFARQIYLGDPLNNTGQNGYQEFYGLDILINTGHQDAVSKKLCPAADSIIESFNNAEIRTNGALLIRRIASIYRRLRYLATRAGLDPVKWTLCMPWSLFWEMTELWPCEYYTYRCAIPINSGSFGNVNLTELDALRQQMRGNIYDRTGQFLLIDNERVDVTIDDGITETQVAGGSFRADMYFVPLTVLGGMPVTYMDYFNFDAPGGAMEFADVFSAPGMFYTSDAGRFLWHKKPPNNFCTQILAVTKPRLMLLVPYLAARLTDLQWTPDFKERDWDPSGPSFFVNGGMTQQNPFGPSFWPPVDYRQDGPGKV